MTLIKTEININNVNAAIDWKKWVFHEVTWIVKNQIPLWSAELSVSIAIPHLLFCINVKLKKEELIVYFFFFPIFKAK